MSLEAGEYDGNIKKAWTECHLGNLLAIYFRLKKKKSAFMQETQVSSLGWEAPLEREMATHYITLGLENSVDRGAWQAFVERSPSLSRTPEV